MFNITSKMDSRWSVYSKFKKCGELTVSEELNAFGLNCVFCETICLKLDSFVKHIKCYHKSAIVDLFEYEDAIEELDKTEVDDTYTEFIEEEIAMDIKEEHIDMLDENLTTESIDSQSPFNDNETFLLNESNESNNAVEAKKEQVKDEDDNDVDDDDDEHSNFANIDIFEPEPDSDGAQDTHNSSNSDLELDDLEVPKLKKSKLHLSIDVHSPENYPLLLSIINGYKNNPTLWDTGDASFFRPHLKRRVLVELTKEIYHQYKINFKPTDVRQIFKGLRRLYNEELQNSTSGTSKEKWDKRNIPKLWCYEQMTFLNKLKSQSELSITFDKQLIIAEIYENYPALWNMQDKSYRLKKIKDAAFEQMLEETNERLETEMSSHQLANCIRSVRKCYITNKRHRMQSTQQKLPYEPPHPEYVNILQYLDGHVGPFQCKICDIMTQTFDHHRKHMNKHYGKPDYSCDICHIVMNHPTNLQVHRRIHTGETPYSCNQCERAFSSSSTLRIHMRVHTGDRPYICDICGKTYKTSSFLARHKMCHNPESFRFECTMCPKKMPDKRHLREHMNAHLDRREHICKTCNKGFFARKTLRQHEQLHLEHKKHSCNICGKTFAQKSGVHSHLHRVHKISTIKASTASFDTLVKN